MRKIFWQLILAGLVVQANPVLAQLNSDETLPADVKFDPQTKFTNDLDEYGGQYKTNYKYKDNLHDFFSVSNYELQILYKSGKVVYNKKIDDYLNNVLNKVIASDPDLKDRLRIFVIKSSQVNAFTFHSGEIFITMGLIAQLGNEAQLAYILAHEVSHYKLGHHVSSIIKTTERKRARTNNNNNNLSEEAEELLDYAFSRELEFEADSLGFSYVKKTPYASSASLGAMDVLQFSYLPLNEVVFDPEKLFRDSIFIPSSLVLDKIHSINFDSDKEEDTRSTHPNIAKRRKYLSHLSDKLGNNTGTSYVLGKKEFTEVRDLARKEFCSLLLQQKEGVMGFYNAYVLYEGDKSSLNQDLMAKGLYEIAMEKQFDTFSSNNPSDDFSEGEIERTYHFFNEISDEQALFIALYSNYLNYKENHRDFSKILCQQIIETMLVSHSITIGEIKSYFEVKAVEDALTVPTTHDSVTTANPDEEEDSKYAKIRKQKIEQIDNVTDSTVADPLIKFHYKLFENLVKDPDFLSLYSGIEDKHFSAMSGKSKEETTVKVTFTGNKKVSADHAVSVQKGLIFSPIYTTSVKTYTDLFKLDQGQKNFSLTAANDYAETGAQIETMSFESVSVANSVAEYNNYCDIMAYVNEVFRKDSKYTPLAYEEMLAIKEANGYSHVLLEGLSSSRQQRSNIGQAVLVGIIAFPLFPAMLYYVSTKELRQRCYINIIDLNNHQQVVEEKKTLGSKKINTPADFFSSFIKK